MHSFSLTEVSGVHCVVGFIAARLNIHDCQLAAKQHQIICARNVN